MIRGSQYADSTATPTVKGSQFAARPSTESRPVAKTPTRVPSQSADLVPVKGGYVSKTDFQAMSAADQERVKSLGVEEFNKEKQASYQKFTTENIEVRPNEWMPIVSYNELSTEDKARIKSVGIEQFNSENKAQYQKFIAENIEVRPNEWMLRQSFSQLDDTDKARIKLVGIEKFNDENKAKADVFKATHVEVRPDEWAVKTEFDALSSEDQSRMRTVGIKAFNDEKDAAFKAINIEVRPNEWISKDYYDSLTPTDQGLIRLRGVDSFIGSKNQEREYAISKLKPRGCIDDEGNIYPAKYLSQVGVDVASRNVLRMAGLSEAEVDSYAQDIKGKIDTMIALTPYHVFTPEQRAALSSGKMVSTDFFPETGVGESYDVLTAAAQNKVTTTQLLNARFIEDTPQAIKEFEDKVAVKKALVPYKDNAVNAVIDKAVTLDQVESLGYDRKQVQTAVDALTALKDYYVPEHTVPNPEFIGPVDTAHPATSTITIPEGYRTYDAAADGVVTTAQLVSANFIANTPEAIKEFETQVEKTREVRQTLQNLEPAKTADGFYDSRKIQAALTSGVVTLNQLRNAGFDVASAETLQDEQKKIEAYVNSKEGYNADGMALMSAIQNAGYQDKLQYWRDNAGWHIGSKSIGLKNPFTSDTLPYATIVKTGWNNLTPEEKANVTYLWAADKYKGSFFAETSKLVSEGGARGGIAGQLIVSPVTGITQPIAKKITGQHVSTGEWVGAGVTAVADALMLSPLLGTLPRVGIIATSAKVGTAGVIGYGAVQYAQGVRQMTNAERAVYGGILLLGAGALVHSSLSPAQKTKISSTLRGAGSRLELRTGIIKGTERVLASEKGFLGEKAPVSKVTSKFDTSRFVDDIKPADIAKKGAKVKLNTILAVNEAGELVPVEGALRGRAGTITVAEESLRPLRATETKQTPARAKAALKAKFEQTTALENSVLKKFDQLWERGRIQNSRSLDVDSSSLRAYEKYLNQKYATELAKDPTYVKRLMDFDPNWVVMSSKELLSKLSPSELESLVSGRQTGEIMVINNKGQLVPARKGFRPYSPEAHESYLSRTHANTPYGKWLNEQFTARPFRVVSTKTLLSDPRLTWETSAKFKAYYDWARPRWVEPKLSSVEIGTRVSSKLELEMNDILRKGQMKNAPSRTRWVEETKTQIGGLRPISLKERITLSIKGISDTVDISPKSAVERFGIKAVKTVFPDIEQLVGRERLNLLLANKTAALRKSYIKANPNSDVARALRVYDEGMAQNMKLMSSKQKLYKGMTTRQIVQQLVTIDDSRYITDSEGGGFWIREPSALEWQRLLETHPRTPVSPKLDYPLWISDRLRGLVLLAQVGGIQVSGEMPKSVSAFGHIDSNGKVVFSAKSPTWQGVYKATNPVKGMTSLIRDNLVHFEPDADFIGPVSEAYPAPEIAIEGTEAPKGAQVYVLSTHWSVDPKQRTGRINLIKVQGDTDEARAWMLVNQVIQSVEKEGWNTTLKRFGLLPVLEVYPKAIIYAAEEAGAIDYKQVQAALDKAREYYKNPTNSGSKEASTSILKYLEGSEKSLKKDMPDIPSTGTGKSTTGIWSGGPLSPEAQRRIREENVRSAQTYETKSGIRDPWLLKPKASLPSTVVKPTAAATATLSPVDLKIGQAVVLPEIEEQPSTLPYPDINLSTLTRKIELVTPSILLKDIVELGLSVSARQRAQQRSQTIVNNITKHAQRLSQKNLTISQLAQQLQQEARTEVQQQQNQQVKQAVQVAVQVAVQQVVQQIVQQAIQKPTPQKATPPFIIIPPTGRRTTEPPVVYPPGSVGWRQGKLRGSVYYVMYKEHGKIVMKYHGQTPPVGVKLTSGARSAYESFGRTAGRIPKVMQKGLGIMDVQSLAHGKELRFKRVLSRGRKGKPTTSKVR